MTTNTINGKAFEYACLKAIQAKLNEQGRDVAHVAGAPYNTARGAYESLADDQKIRYDMAAQTAVKLLFPLEPHVENGSGTIVLSIAADSAAQGPDGDVRDVLMVRVSDDWEVGISCKHNHAALKHPRITADQDFGRDWIGYRCSGAFLDAMSPVIEPLVDMGNRGTKWRDVDNKQDRFYLPILQAYRDEIERLCSDYPDAPEKIITYFFGANDFYKVIMKEATETTIIEGFNMHGTLGKPCNGVRPLARIAKMDLPKRLIEARLKENSKTTIILTFDNGWSVSMRLHNKDKIAKPTSLAWDVNLIGLPPETYRSVKSWYE